MLRKHIKVEPARWYYHCDKIGMLVWQDMPSGAAYPGDQIAVALPNAGIHVEDKNYKRFKRENEAARAQFTAELREMVNALRDTVCVCTWVPFNEGWGQFDSLQAAQLLWELDATRLVDHASGWHDQGGGDFKSRHVYFRPVRLKHDKIRVLALSEFGGYSLPVAGHVGSAKSFGYRMYQKPAAFMDALVKLYENEVIPCMEKQGLSAAVYTQVSDVEDEVNGLLTYDRKVCKADVRRMKAVNEKLKFPM